MIRKVEQWVFSEEDKEQIKSYSKDISILFKIRGYDPTSDDFECFFDSVEDFDFIPCVREYLDNADDDDDEQEIMDCLDSAYDPSVEVTLQYLEEYVKKSSTNTETVRGTLENLVDYYGYDTNDLLDFIFSCGVNVKQKFIDFLTK